MQFAGQRTDIDLNPIGDPYNVLVALNDDTLPSPDALMVTGISPQQTVTDGYTEAQFAQLLADEIFTEDTTAIGFNNIRFDDEFVRHLLWRNFHDPYEWSWRDGRSRWDLLDVVRMTRALRPDGIEWPVVDGKAVNKLELLSSANNLEHTKAHDALSDVVALIGVSKLIRDRQPQLFNYLLEMRDKNNVKQLVNLDDKRPFVYSSGRYDAEFHKTTIAFPLTSSRNGNVAVYDLRHDPTPFVDMSAQQLRDTMYATREARRAEGFVSLPVKELQYNRAPAVAPINVLEAHDGWTRLGLMPETVKRHQQILLDNPQFAENIRTLYESAREFKKSADPEAQLYDGFLSDRDKLRVETVRNATERELVDFHPEFIDERLPELLLHYKARNFPKSLSEAEMKQWESWRAARIQRALPGFVARLNTLSATTTDSDNQFILEELKLWAESVMPSDLD